MSSVDRWLVSFCWCIFAARALRIVSPEWISFPLTHWPLCTLAVLSLSFAVELNSRSFSSSGLISHVCCVLFCILCLHFHLFSVSFLFYFPLSPSHFLLRMQSLTSSSWGEVVLFFALSLSLSLSLFPFHQAHYARCDGSNGQRDWRLMVSVLKLSASF